MRKCFKDHVVFTVVTNQQHLIFEYHQCLYYHNRVLKDILDNCLLCF